jgi:hypothetical protein
MREEPTFAVEASQMLPVCDGEAAPFCRPSGGRSNRRRREFGQIWVPRENLWRFVASPEEEREERK